MLLSVFMTITSVGWLHAQNEGYTQDGNNYKVTTAKGLQAVFAKLNKATTAQTTTITLENDLDISDGAGVTVQGPNLDFQGIFYLTADTDKIASLTIDGQDYAIAGENTSGQNFDPSKKYVFYLDGSGDSPITFKNLTIENTNILAFNLFNLNNLKFDKVALKNNAEGGLHLNSAQLEATGFTTSGNGKFAVKLSRERDNKPKFTLVSGTIGEKNVPQIAFFDRHAYEVWSGNPQSSIEDISNAVVTPAGESWYRSLQYAKMHTSNNSNLAYVWTKDDASVLVSTAGQLDSTFSVGFATATEINLAAGTYDLKKVAEVKGNLAIIGEDSTKTVVSQGFKLSGTDKQIVSFKNMTIKDAATAIELTNPKVDLTIENAALHGTYGVKYNNYTDTQATEAPSYTVKNSYIKANKYYALWTRSTGKYTWTIENSVLEGWSALYTSLGTPNITVTDSKLYGITTSTASATPAYTNGSSGNGFATIVFESTQNGNITLDNTEVKSSWTASAKDILNPVIFQVMADQTKNPKHFGVSGNTLTLKNNSSMWIEKPVLTPIFIYHGASDDTYGKEENNWVNVDNSVKFTYGAENKSAMVVAAADGKIRTAVAPIQDGIDNMNYWTADGDIVTLPIATIDLTKQWEITNAVTLQGIISGTDTTSIVAATEWEKCPDKNDSTLIEIKSDNVSFKNLNVKNSMRNGINVFEAKNVTLNNVTIQNSKAAGMVVNSSEVAISNFKTSGNKWGYGVNVDKGSRTDAPEPLLTIGSGCSFGEAIAIKSDNPSASDKYVSGNGWVRIEKEGIAYWINSAASGINFAITSIPETVVYGQKNLPLVANITGDNVSITVPDNNGVVSIIKKDSAPDSLQFLKPGTVDLTLSVGDTTVTQSLTVLKKTLTVTGITAKKRAYNGNTTVELVTDDIVVKGLVGEDTKSILGTLTGTLMSANAGNAVPVKVSATLSSKADYYELAEITGVTDTITKVDLTITTKKPSAVDYGQVSNVVFAVDNTDLVNNENLVDLSGNLQFDCPATNTSLAGKYPVTPYGYTSGNYNIKYVADTLEVQAIAPTAELTGVKVNSVGKNASITVSGRILSNGGTPNDKITAEFTPKFGSTTGTAKTVNVANDGTFSADITGLSDAEYTVELKVTGSDKTSSAITSSAVDLNAQLQNVELASIPTRLTYGNSVAISAKSTEADAKIEFSLEGTSGVLAFNKDTTAVIATQKGEATIVVKATKDQFVTAVAKQTISVEPKLVTVTATAEDKVYDGKTDAKVSFKASGILDSDKNTVSLASTSAITAAFTDKNVGDKKTVILTGECELVGNNASNYTLIQPANPTANITKATIKSIAANADGVKRKYNEKTLSYKLVADGLVNGETLTTKDLYSGTISLKENKDGDELNGKYTLTVDATFRNYNYTGSKTITGNVEIEKGIPTVITFNTTEQGKPGGYIVDKAGWADTRYDIVTVDGSAHAICYYNNDQSSVIGNTVDAKQTAPVLNISLGEATSTQTASVRRNALVTRAGSANSMTYGEERKLTISTGGTFTLTTATPSVLIIDNQNNITAVGTGQGAILAERTTDGAIAEILISVAPKTLGVTSANVNKEYDGTTTANLSLTVADNIDNVSLDLKDISFNYASKDAGSQRKIAPSLELALTGANSNNYELDASSLTTALQGTISPRTLTVTSQVSKFYDGTATMTLDDYSAEGLLTEEAAPKLEATFTGTGAANVGTAKNMKLSLTGSNNYRLDADKSPKTGNIVKSTLEAIFPEKATNVTDLKNKLTYVLHQTGDTIKANAAINANITVTGTGTEKDPFMVKATENDNCTFIINNKSVDKAEVPPVTPPSDIDVNGIELDETSLTLQLNETATLTAAITPDNATNQKVEWSSSDPTIVSVAATEADGKIAKITALKAGEVTITVTSNDNFNFTATCKVKVEAPTGLEEALANSKVYAKEGYIYIEPLAEMQVVVVSMSGKVIYNSRISSQKQIPATPGVYVVKLISAHKSITTKVGIF
ncbi:hypothetical protein DW103_04980 [Parabacteroides sp. AM08-6]|nr:hypothetical protein DW103_04980 [Parabacteroides sp. AM08-6]